MSNPTESAGHILKLYELRREKKLRKARMWFASQHFRSAQDLVEAGRGKDNAYFRMVTSYWNMVAALVNHGGIDAAMFHDANNEHVFVWGKLEPFMEEFRAAVRQPTYLVHLQRMIEAMPDGKERVGAMQERQRAAADAAARAEKKAPEPVTSGGRA
jgi:hypothetical protein